MSAADAPRRGWYRRFVEQIDPGERLGELLFGLIMVLTFTLGAGIELAGDAGGARELLIAALGCNAAWGIIDAALLLIGRLSDRGRLHRVFQSIQQAPSREQALALVDRELDERLPAGVRRELRASLAGDVLEQVRKLEIAPTRVTLADLSAASVVFLLVFLTALPAVIPFLVIEQPHLALRASNAVLIAMLFFVGWRWASFTGASRWRTGVAVTLLSTALVLVAIALGG